MMSCALPIVLQLEAGQAGLREYLNGLEVQLQQLQAQLTEQEAAAGEPDRVGGWVGRWVGWLTTGGLGKQAYCVRVAADWMCIECSDGCRWAAYCVALAVSSQCLLGSAGNLQLSLYTDRNCGRVVRNLIRNLPFHSCCDHTRHTSYRCEGSHC